MTRTGVLYELTFRCRPCGPGVKEALLSALAGAGVSPDEVAEFWEKGGVRFSVYASTERQAEKIRRAVRDRKPEGVRAARRVLRPDDWQTRWKKYYRPFMITRRIRIVPRQAKKGVRPLPGVRDILIDSRIAFGTGLHATTQEIAGFLEGTSGGYRDFLDVGTGTGILALIAAAGGAREIWAFDVEKEAVRTAATNFAANRLRVRRLAALDFGRFRSRREFDFVAANLLSNILVALRDRLLAAVRPGKYLAVSGIEKSEAARFRREFETRDMECLRCREKKGWVALLYRRRGAPAEK